MITKNIKAGTKKGVAGSDAKKKGNTPVASASVAGTPSEVADATAGVDPTRLRRNKPTVEGTPKQELPPVSAGPIDRVVELVYNPSREKIREMTVVDRIQARLLPQLDIIGLMWQYCIEAAIYRRDPNEYRRITKKQAPEAPDLIGEFTYRTAQWQKSIGGQNMKSATDLALAELENRSMEGGEPFGDGFTD